MCKTKYRFLTTMDSSITMICAIWYWPTVSQVVKYNSTKWSGLWTWSLLPPRITTTFNLTNPFPFKIQTNNIKCSLRSRWRTSYLHGATTYKPLTGLNKPSRGFDAVCFVPPTPWLSIWLQDRCLGSGLVLLSSMVSVPIVD